MNCKQAKTLPIQALLASLGFMATRTTRKGTWYHSPFCGKSGDHIPSFQVSPDGKGFRDWSSGASGNIIDLAGLMIGVRDVSQALRFIANAIRGNGIHPKQNASPMKREDENCWLDVSVEPLHTGSLCSYLYRRGISWDTAKKYCVEVRYFRPGCSTEYFAVGFENRSGGYELRNPFYKGAMAPKDITVVGEVSNKKCLVFEGFSDFLSAVEMGWFREDRMTAVVLNSTSLVERGIKAMEGASEVICLMDGDAAGRKATHTICSTLPFASDHSSLFTQHGFKDLNELRKSQLRMNNIFNKAH